MPDPITIAAGLAAGAQMVSSGAQAIGTSVANRKSYKYTKELSKYAYSKDLEMWNRANAYNSPGSQMARLKSAGLNPNLVYGTGTVSGNTTSQLPKHSAPEARFNPVVPVDPMAVMSAYFDIRAKEETVRNIKESTNLREQEVVEAKIQNWINQEFREEKLSQLFSQSLKDFYDASIAGNEALVQAKTVQAQIRLKNNLADLSDDQKTKIKEEISQLGAGNMLKEWGVTPQDSPMLRMIVMLMDLLGVKSPYQESK